MTRPIIEARNLTFRYDKREQKRALSSISFTVNQGEWLAIVGKNGSGKSTLASLLVGLLTPESGEIIINDMALKKESIWEIRGQIGIVFQNPENQFIGATVQDDVAFGLENLNLPYSEMKERVEDALRLVDMLDFKEHNPAQLSGGQKQRVAIASVLALKPSIIIFDEALNMLDPTSRQELLVTLQKLRRTEQITFLSITHDMDEAALADRILSLKNGRIVTSGTPGEVFTSAPDLEVPFPERLRRELGKRGRNVPNQYMTEKEMVEWLWK